MQCMHSRSTCSRHRPAVDLLLNVAGLSIAAWWSISFVQNSILRWRRTNPTYLFDNLQTAVRLPIAVIRVGLYSRIGDMISDVNSCTACRKHIDLHNPKLRSSRHRRSGFRRTPMPAPFCTLTQLIKLLLITCHVTTTFSSLAICV